MKNIALFLIGHPARDCLALGSSPGFLAVLYSAPSAERSPGHPTLAVVLSACNSSILEVPVRWALLLGLTGLTGERHGKRSGSHSTGGWRGGGARGARAKKICSGLETAVVQWKQKAVRRASFRDISFKQYMFWDLFVWFQSYPHREVLWSCAAPHRDQAWNLQNLAVCCSELGVPVSGYADEEVTLGS